MGQGPFSWLRPFRTRSEKKAASARTSHSQPSSPPPGYYYPQFEARRRTSDPDVRAPSSSNSSTIPYHSNQTVSHYPPPPPTALSSHSLFAADVPPLPPPPPTSPVSRLRPPRAKNSRRSRRANPQSYGGTNGWLAPEEDRQGAHIHFKRATSGYTDPGRGPASPASPVDYGPRSADLEQLALRTPPSYASSEYMEEPAPHSVGHSAFNVSTPPPALDNFVPHRPTDRQNMPRPYHPPSTPPAPPMTHEMPYGPPMHRQIPEFRVSTITPDVPSMDHVGPGSTMSPMAADVRREESPKLGEYSKRLGDAPNRFLFRRRAAASDSAAHHVRDSGSSAAHRGFGSSSRNAPPVHVEDEYFGTNQHDDRARNSEIRQGEEVLLKFLRNTLGPKAQNLAVRLMNKTPITSSANFSYVIHQATEDSDLDIIRRDLTNGRLYTSGVRLIGGGWCNLLLGDRFTTGSSTRQRHELTYRRSTCSCIICRVRTMELVRQQQERRPGSEFGESDVESNGISADVLSTMSSRTRTPTHSAMANFVVRCKLPSNEALMSIGASASSRELEIGTVVRLNYRASAKLKFTEDVRELFGHFAYTGPISHEEVYRRVTTIGVHYYLYNKGKKERKVYIQGALIRLPVQVGVVKLGTQPMYMPELGATFCLHRKQIMSIYVGEIVLEGNSLGSFIKTGIRYYIGFGEERGVCPVYPNKTLGKARKLGINELLLHHHMVDDLEVRCI